MFLSKYVCLHCERLSRFISSEKTKSFLSISLMLLVTVASQNDFHGVALLG